MRTDRNTAHPYITLPPVACCAPRRARLNRCPSERGRAYRLLPAPGGSPHTVFLIGPGPEFDPLYAMGTYLDERVVIASVTADSSGQPYPLLIDGRSTKPLFGPVKGWLVPRAINQVVSW